MKSVKRNTRASDLCCADLEEMGVLDASGCCETCHYAEAHTLDGVASLGPCSATLPDGRLAFVCCTARKQLLGGAVS